MHGDLYERNVMPDFSSRETQDGELHRLLPNVVVLDFGCAELKTLGPDGEVVQKRFGSSELEDVELGLDLPMDVGVLELRRILHGFAHNSTRFAQCRLGKKKCPYPCADVEPLQTEPGKLLHFSPNDDLFWSIMREPAEKVLMEKLKEMSLEPAMKRRDETLTAEMVEFVRKTVLMAAPESVLPEERLIERVVKV